MRTWKTGPGRRSSGHADDDICGQIPGARPGRDADRAVTALYLTHYRSLVRLAALLVPDLATAEEIVQDSFAAVCGGGPALPDADSTLRCLRRSVVDRSRSVPRSHPSAATRPPDRQAGDDEAGRQLERTAVLSALWALPTAQREVLVLRYFADLPETQIAAVTGFSREEVRRHATLAMSSLRTELHSADD